MGGIQNSHIPVHACKCNLTEKTTTRDETSLAFCLFFSCPFCNMEQMDDTWHDFQNGAVLGFFNDFGLSLNDQSDEKHVCICDFL